ncbi:MAG: cytochrome P450 [Alphaproteobacteria bacterium]
MTEAATRSMRIDDPDLLSGDPFPFYRELRARPGLWRDDEAGLWVATRLEHVVSISRDPATFCSSRGVLPSDRQRTLTPRESVLYIDPPDHGKYRKLVQPVFAPGRLRVLEAHVRDIVRGLLDAIPPGEEVEFVSAFSVPLPLVVIAEMLGVPAADRDRFKIWSDAVIEAGTRQTPENMAQAMELLGYFSEVLARRRVEPGDDIISLLATSDVDGERLDEFDVLMFCMSLLVAGNETTRNLISHGVHALSTHPGELAKLVADRPLVPRAVEEMLRWGTPIAGFLRTATREVEAFGARFRDGDQVLMVYAAANRDPAVFGDDAEEFRVSRDATGHVAFGFGEHFCLGAVLARMEARIAFEEILGRFSRIEPAGPVGRLSSNVMRGVVRLPVVLRA